MLRKRPLTVVTSDPEAGVRTINFQGTNQSLFPPALSLFPGSGRRRPCGRFSEVTIIDFFKEKVKGKLTKAQKQAKVSLKNCLFTHAHRNLLDPGDGVGRAGGGLAGSGRFALLHLRLVLLEEEVVVDTLWPDRRPLRLLILLSFIRFVVS